MELFPKEEKSMLKKTPDSSQSIYPSLPSRASTFMNFDDSIKKDPRPSFPDCSFLRGCQTADGTFWVSVIDLLKSMQYKVSNASYTKKLKDASSQTNFRTITVNCDLIWNQQKEVWNTLLAETESHLCVDANDLKPFAMWYVSKQRKSKAEKVRVCRLIGVEIDEEDKVKVPIENELLANLERACPFEMQRQYHIDRYRLDAFFPRIRVAIEIDEHGHSDYNTHEERRKDTIIRDHNIVLIRFNPHNDMGKVREGAVLELIHKVWSRVMDPDFTSFRDKHNLT